MMNLVIGASGQIGQHLFRAIQSADEKVIGSFNNYHVPGLFFLNIAEKASVHQVIQKYNPDVIYLPAYLSNVDYCELHPRESSQINIRGVENVVDELEGTDVKLIFFSSDYIFDGINGPYSELDVPNPICEYGRQKLKSEQYISQKLNNYLICRSTVVYSWETQGKNFVHRLIRSLKNGAHVNVPTDQTGTPTYAPNLSQVLLELVQNDHTGTYNVSGPDLVSRYDFARAVARIFDLDEHLIHGIKTEDLHQPAKRPLNGGLIIDKVTRNTSCRLLNYQQGLQLMKSELDIPVS
jgi:dTDP-4-dehydrorhamnose reductase